MLTLIWKVLSKDWNWYTKIGQDYIGDFDFDSGKLGIAGYGFGIDLGVSYKIMDNLTVSASVLDLGFISWTKGATKIASANPESINMKGTSYVNGIDGERLFLILLLRRVQNNITQLQADADGYYEPCRMVVMYSNYEMLQLQTEDVH